MDYLIAHLLPTLVVFKNDYLAREKWPEAIVAKDDTSDEEKIGNVDQEGEEMIKPIIQEKPFVDPNEMGVFHWTDLTKPMDELINPADVSNMYLLNPFSILTCLSLSTQLFDTLFVILALYFAIKHRFFPCAFFLALATYQSLYPIVLLAPCIQILSCKGNSRVRTSLALITIFCFFLIGLLCWSFYFIEDWSFLNATYGVMSLILM